MTHSKTSAVALTLTMLLVASQAYAGCGGGGAGGRGFRLFGRGRAGAGACSGSATMTQTYSYSSAGSCGQGYAPQYMPTYAPQYPTPQYPQPTPQQMQPAPATYGNGASNAQDYGFVGWLNRLRGQRGLRAVTLDANACAWAAQNNVAQQRSGLGHWVRTMGRRQNSGWGAQQTVWQAWTTSPGHMDALLDPQIASVGIAFDGQYWTFNGN